MFPDLPALSQGQQHQQVPLRAASAQLRGQVWEEARIHGPGRRTGEHNRGPHGLLWLRGPAHGHRAGCGHRLCSHLIY